MARRTFLVLTMLLGTGLLGMAAAGPRDDVVDRMRGGPQGDLVCATFDAAAALHGCEAWVSDTQGEASSVAALAVSRPLGLVLTVGWVREAGAQHALLEARHEESGQMAWRRTFAPRDTNEWRQVAVSPDGQLAHVVGASRNATGGVGLLATYQLADGALLWSEENPSVPTRVAAGPGTMYDHVIYPPRFPGNPKMGVVEARVATTGAVVRFVEFYELGLAHDLRVAGDGSVAVTHTEHDGLARTYVFDAGLAKFRWSVQRGVVLKAWSATVVSGGSLVGLVSGEELAAFDLQTGAPLWRVPFASGGERHLIAAPPDLGLLHLVGIELSGPVVTILRASDGSVVARTPTSLDLASAIAADAQGRPVVAGVRTSSIVRDPDHALGFELLPTTMVVETRHRDGTPAFASEHPRWISPVAPKVSLALGDDGRVFTAATVIDGEEVRAVTRAVSARIEAPSGEVVPAFLPATA